MKQTTYFSIIFFCLVTIPSIAQHKKHIAPMEDEIAYSNIYVQYGHHKPHNLNITNKNILQLFGKPSAINIEKSEIDGGMYKEYTYPFGKIYIEGNAPTDNIEFKAKGLAYIFKIKGALTKPISVGDNASYLGAVFPKSRKVMRENIFEVWITGTESTVSFEINNGYITKMSLFTNES